MRIFRANLTGSLDIDVEQDISARGDGTVKRCAGSAVVGVENLRPFRQFAGRELAFKFPVGHEAIIDSVNLARARRPGRQ